MKNIFICFICVFITIIVYRLISDMIMSKIVERDIEELTRGLSVTKVPFPQKEVTHSKIRLY